MSHVFQIPDDIYTEIAAYAAQRGQTPDALQKPERESPGHSCQG